MGRNTPKNIKIHNDKLHKEQAKKKVKELTRKEKLKEIVRKFNDDKN
jgi:cell division protein FtsL